MCDYFLHITSMENNQGDLADIVRAPTVIDNPFYTEFPIADTWQPPTELTGFPPPTQHQEEEFGHPFANLRDPLNEFDGSSIFLDGGELLAQKILSEEMRRPCNVFSRMLQISPEAAKASPLSPRAIRPSPMVSGDMLAAIGSAPGCSRSSPAGIKRRKSQAKKVVCIPAPAAAGSRPTGEVIPSDLWAWRKYGQKPIKGSPYPRGYYRCSSSKGCSARKQVERSRTDPNMLVITYTSEHNHPWPTQRNALAGSTRSQLAKNNSSATSKSSPPHNQRLAPSSLKEEEPKDAMSSSSPLVIGEEVEMEMEMSTTIDQEFDQVFQYHNYKPMIPDSNQSDDFFADLAELEPDPMKLIFSKGYVGGKSEEDTKELDPYNMFEWAGSSFGEPKKGL